MKSHPQSASWNASSTVLTGCRQARPSRKATRSSSLNGTSVPPSVADMCSKKTVTAFVDGDRGGDLIIKELIAVADIDFVTKAPDGKEVEEITKKEIHKALRSRITG